MLLSLRGSACLYQGEELGLHEADVAFEDLQDPYGIEFWPEFKGRDGCRTPMVWETQSEHAGFGDGKPWLPVSAEQAAMAVDRQEADPEAMLHHYRAAVALRQSSEALRNGEQTDLTAKGNLLTFQRVHGGEVLLCAFNLGNAEEKLDLPIGNWTPLGTGLRGAVAPAGRDLTLPAWGYSILAKGA
jgi:alpha-glucosidase